MIKKQKQGTQNRKKTFIEDVLGILLTSNIKYDLSCFCLSRDMIGKLIRVKSSHTQSYHLGVKPTALF